MTRAYKCPLQSEFGRSTALRFEDSAKRLSRPPCGSRFGELVAVFGSNATRKASRPLGPRGDMKLVWILAIAFYIALTAWVWSTLGFVFGIATGITGLVALN